MLSNAAYPIRNLFYEMHSVFLRYDDDYDVYHLLLSVSKKGVLLNMHVADSAFPASTNQLIFRALEQKAFAPVT